MTPALATRRKLGSLIALFVLDRGSMTRYDCMGIDLFETDLDARLAFEGDVQQLAGIPRSGQVRSIIYRLADNRMGDNTTGKDAGHIFQSPVSLEQISKAEWRLKGGYRVAPEGIRG